MRRRGFIQSILAAAVCPMPTMGPLPVRSGVTLASLSEVLKTLYPTEKIEGAIWAGDPSFVPTRTSEHARCA